MTGVTPDSLRLSWTVAQGPFDSFVILYKDAQGQPQSVPIEGVENEVTVPGLESNRKYKMNLYGLRGRQRVGPVSVVAKTGESEPHMAPFTAGPKPHAGPAPAPPSLSAEASASFFLGSSYIPTSQDASPKPQIPRRLPHSFPPLLHYTLPRRPLLQPQFAAACTELPLALIQFPVFLLTTPAPSPQLLLCARAADSGDQGAMLLQSLHRWKGLLVTPIPIAPVRLAPGLIYHASPHAQHRRPLRVLYCY